MKSVNIFVKTLKTISRNWKYFSALFLFPLLLILVAGGVLNSINVDNIRVGFVFDALESDDFDFQKVKFTDYPSLDSCLHYLSTSSVGICVHFQENNEIKETIVYHAGTNKIVEQYARSFILEEVSKQQDIILLETSEKIGENLDFYKGLFLETRNKLVETRAELVLERENLIERKKEVQQIKEDYLEIYYPLKESEDEFFAMKAKIESNQESLEDSLNRLKSMSSNIDFYLSELEKLPLDSEQQVYIDEIREYKTELDNFISLYESTYEYDQLKQILDNVAEIYSKLDMIKEVLEKTEDDLDRTIEKILEIIDNIDIYLIELGGHVQGLDEFGEESEYEGINWKIVSLSPSTDPILLSFPLLVSIIIMFTSVILSNMSTSKQIHEKSYFREMITPVKKMKFLFSNYLVKFFFVLIQLVVLIFIGVFFVGIPKESILLFVIGSFFISSIFIFAGSSISYLIRQKSLSSLISIFVLIFSFVISSVIAPSILITRSLQKIMGFNPFVIFNNFLEIIFISEGSFPEVSSLLLKMVGFFFLFGFILIYSRKRHDKRLGA